MAKQLPPELLAVQQQLQTACSDSKARLEECAAKQDSEGEAGGCDNAYKALVFCMGQVICKDEAEVFRQALEKPEVTNEELGNAFEAMSVRIGDFEQRSRAALLEK